MFPEYSLSIFFNVYFILNTHTILALVGQIFSISTNIKTDYRVYNIIFKFYFFTHQYYYCINITFIKQSLTSTKSYAQNNTRTRAECVSVFTLDSTPLCLCAWRWCRNKVRRSCHFRHDYTPSQPQAV